MENVQMSTAENSSQQENQSNKKHDYQTKAYWQMRYINTQGFYDWYIGYQDFNKYIEELCPEICKQSKFLNVGCGNSKLAIDMYLQGYKNSTNIDISEIVIDQMNKEALKRQIQDENLKFLAMDATDLSLFANQSFDCVYDKGTLDALLCGQQNEIPVQMLREMARVVKTQGIILIITFGSPQQRLLLFEEVLGFDDYQYWLCKQQLSLQASLINIMRSNAQNQPLNVIMQDNALMMKTLLEFKKSKNIRENQLLQEQLVDWSIYFQDEEEQLQITDQQKLSEKINEQLPHNEVLKEQVSVGIKDESIDKQENEVVLEEQKEMGQTDIKIQDQKQETSNAGVGGGRRQEFCYIYKIKRIKKENEKEINNQYTIKTDTQ